MEKDHAVRILVLYNPIIVKMDEIPIFGHESPSHAGFPPGLEVVSIITSKKIPAEFFLTEFMIRNTEFRRNSVKIPYSTEFCKNSVFRGILYKFRSTEFRKKYGIPELNSGGILGKNSAKFRRNSGKNMEFRNLIPAKFREKIPQNSGGIPYHGIPLDTLAPMVYNSKPK